ncbi:MAG: hypothetical protein IKP10_08255 [Clostridia bacterium]|nr:hypothetical protein [Clostridia bacterium]
MKRLMSLLLSAALLLACCGCAAEDAVHTRLTLTADREQLAQYFAQLGLPDDGASSLAGALAELAGNASLDNYMADTELQTVLSLSGEALVTLNVREEDGQILTAGSLLPGAVVAMPVSESSALAELLYAQTNIFDILGLISAFSEAAESWQRGLLTEESVGSYAGDAYEGGTQCATSRFSDRDLAVLFSTWLTLLEDLPAEDEALKARAGLEIRELRAALNERALRNEYHYILREVSDGSGRRVGLSLTMLKGDDQLATLSAAFDGDALSRLVIGFGQSEEVYFLDCAFAGGDAAFTGTFRLIRDPARGGFASANADEENRVLTLRLNVPDLTVGSDGSAFGYTAEMEIPGAPTLAEETRMVSRDGLLSVDSTVRMADSDKAMYTVAIRQDTQTMPDGQWPADAAVLTLEQTEEIAAAMQNGLLNLLPKLLTLLPAGLPFPNP